jgi:hypothetical protein
MKYLKITNDGLLDLRLIYLMGGTTKANDEFKIGQFGTGLKYTMAFMLRNNIDFKIFIDGREIKLTTIAETIRDTKFEIICIDGVKTSITTNMGLDWETWMIIRELWCNALDEQNAANEITTEINPSPGKTEYYIQMVPDVTAVVNDWDKYFIHGREPIMDCKHFAIYPGGDSLRCYKRGVLIKEIEGQKAVFAYDFKNAELNELREMRFSAQWQITKVFPYFDQKTADVLVNNILDTFESTIDFHSYFCEKYGQGWRDAIGSAKIMDNETYEKIIDRIPAIKESAVVRVPKGLFKELIKHFPSISLLRASDKLNEFFETYSDVLHDKTAKCLKLLESVGYFVDPNLRIIYGVFGDKNIIAQVSIDDKEIRLSQDLESFSDSDLIVALIEENEHYKTGFMDCTREFQSHFIRLYSNLLLKNVHVLI